MRSPGPGFPTPGRLAGALLPALALLALALAAPAAGEVRLVTRPDGTRVLQNVDGGATSKDRADAPSRPPATPALRPAPSLELARTVEEHSAAHGVDPRLVQAVIQAESAWNGRAVSRAGAMGLMQLMPATAVMLAVDDPWDERENVRGGTAYLARMLDRFGDLELALAAYNAGPTAVERYGGIPPYAETREYVRRVLSLYEGRPVSAAELAPYLGDPRAGATRRGTQRRAPGPSSPRFVRSADGRLLVTNETAPRTSDR